jgi:hypothetical protein
MSVSFAMLKKCSHTSISLLIPYSIF